DNGLMNMPFFYTNAHAQIIIGGDAKNNWLTQQVMDSGLLEARRVGYPTSVTFNEDEQDTLATFVMMDSYVDQMVAKFVTGELALSDSEWDAYVNNVTMMDLDGLIEVRQSAYDRWSSK
ncbi:hypothetical protein LJC63_08430, partial [Ruminococcaceae bacterium OttesenSCG-928-L11]|nr:hypothetical protein [Ruminococcaceae bacterium OttesenSCG-928-L11]